MLVVLVMGQPRAWLWLWLWLWIAPAVVATVAVARVKRNWEIMRSKNSEVTTELVSV
jgi:hypothetical protein